MQCREGQGTSSEDVLCEEGVMPETLVSMISYQSAWLLISATILSLPSCAAPTPIPAPISTQPAPVGMVLIPAGEFSMGSVDSLARADERPIHRVRLNAFWMDATEVTNRQFAKFIDATGYKTMAERPVDWDELKKQVPAGLPSHLTKCSRRDRWFSRRRQIPCRQTIRVNGGCGQQAQHGNILKDL